MCAVGLVAPVVSLIALEPLPHWPVLQATVAVAVYAAAGIATTFIATR